MMVFLIFYVPEREQFGATYYLKTVQLFSTQFSFCLFTTKLKLKLVPQVKSPFYKKFKIFQSFVS